MTKFCFKIRPTTIYRVHQKCSAHLNDEILQILNSCGVAHFFNFPPFDQNVPLIERMIDLWSPEEEVFIINGRRMQLTVDHVALITGMPNRGKKVVVSKLAKLDPKKANDWRDDLEGLKIVGSAEDFCKLYLKFLISNVFVISSNFSISTEYLEFSENLVEFSGFNWAEAIHYFLIYKLSDYICRRRRSDNVGVACGFMTILMVLLLCLLISCEYCPIISLFLNLL